MNISRPLSFVASSALPSPQMSTTSSNSSASRTYPRTSSCSLEDEFLSQQSISCSGMMDASNGHGFGQRKMFPLGRSSYQPLFKRGWIFYSFQIIAIFLCGICLYALVDSLFSVISDPLSPPGHSTISEGQGRIKSTWKIYESHSTPYLVTNYTLNNPSLCQSETSSLRHVYFLILVHSAPQNFKARQLIRNTWGSVRNLSENASTKLAFLMGAANSSHVGAAIVRESAIFQDILASTEFLDSYKNLTQKHLMGYHWAMTFCPNVTYVLKTDDDAFIDIRSLYEYVDRSYNPESENGILLCNVFPQGTTPIRDQHSKWFVSSDEYEGEIYPKYCGGLAYLITPNVIRKLYHEAVTKAKFLWVDDVFVTGVLRELAQVDPFYLNLRYNYDPEKYRSWLKKDDEAKKPPFMVTHVERGDKFGDEMRDLWNRCELVWRRRKKLG